MFLPCTPIRVEPIFFVRIFKTIKNHLSNNWGTQRPLLVQLLPSFLFIFIFYFPVLLLIICSQHLLTLSQTQAPCIWWCIWCGHGFCDPHEPTQVSPLTNRVSHRAWIEPGEWLSTASSSPSLGRATPTHGAVGGPQGGPPLTSKPRVSHLPQAGIQQWTGLGTCV